MRVTHIWNELANLVLGAGIEHASLLGESLHTPLSLLEMAVILFVVLYIYAPLKIKTNQIKDVVMDVTLIDRSALPPDLGNVFDHASNELTQCGFECVGFIQHHAAQTGQDAFASVWINPKLSDSAQIIGVSTPVANSRMKFGSLVTYRTEFRDGASIVTTNSPRPSCFPRDSKINSIRCPDIYDLELLYRFHQSRIDLDGHLRTPSRERVQDAVSRLQMEHTETFQRLINAGYYAMDSSGKHYVPTLKGAYLMTYRLLPPFRQIQSFLKNRACERALRESGFEGIRKFRRMQSQNAAVSAFNRL